MKAVVWSILRLAIFADFVATRSALLPECQEMVYFIVRISNITRQAPVFIKQEKWIKSVFSYYVHWQHGTTRIRLPHATDQYLLLARPLQQGLSDRWTDGRMDPRQMHRPCSTCHNVGSAIIKYAVKYVKWSKVNKNETSAFSWVGRTNIAFSLTAAVPGQPMVVDSTHVGTALCPRKTSTFIF